MSAKRKASGRARLFAPRAKGVQIRAAEASLLSRTARPIPPKFETEESPAVTAEEYSGPCSR